MAIVDGNRVTDEKLLEFVKEAGGLSLEELRSQARQRIPQLDENDLRLALQDLLSRLDVEITRDWKLKYSELEN